MRALPSGLLTLLNWGLCLLIFYIANLLKLSPDLKEMVLTMQLLTAATSLSVRQPPMNVFHWRLRRQSVRLQREGPGFDPRGGKSPWRRKWQPTPVLLPWKSHGRWSLGQATIHGVTKSQARLSDFTSLPMKHHTPGRGFRYSSATSIHQSLPLQLVLFNPHCIIK